MITITVLQLLQADAPLQALAQQPFRGESAFRIRRLMQKAAPEVSAAAEARNTLITDENSIPAGPGQRQIRPEHLDAFMADPLFRKTVSIDAEPLSESDLSAAMISPMQLDALGPLLAK